MAKIQPKTPALAHINLCRSWKRDSPGRQHRRTSENREQRACVNSAAGDHDGKVVPGRELTSSRGAERTPLYAASAELRAATENLAGRINPQDRCASERRAAWLPEDNLRQQLEVHGVRRVRDA